MDNSEDKLGEKGFVFRGDDGKPYWCRMQGDAPWFFFWNADNQWVSLKPVNQMQVWMAFNHVMPDEEAQVYHDLAGSNA
jgi:hypothetical protein